MIRKGDYKYADISSLKKTEMELKQIKAGLVMVPNTPFLDTNESFFCPPKAYSSTPLHHGCCKIFDADIGAFDAPYWPSHDAVTTPARHVFEPAPEPVGRSGETRHDNEPCC